MATSRYEVEYEGGLKRHRMLSREDAERLRDTKGVKDVTRDDLAKGRKPAANKQRQAGENKGDE